jgi:zinc protease
MTGVAVTGVAVTGVAVTGVAVTGVAVTGVAVTGVAVTGVAVTGVAVKRASILVALALASACGSAPAPREYPPLPEGTEGAEHPAVELAREPLRDEPVVVAQRSESPVVTFRVVFDAGSAEDTPGREGLTRLTAHLMAEGGAGELSYAELSRRLYPMAATLEVHVGRDETVFVGQVHSDHVEDFYELFRDVLLAPRMGEDDFTRVRDQTLNSLSVDLRNAEDEELGKQALQGLLYQGHPFEHPALGTEAGLRRIRVDDAIAHRGRVFCAGRAFVGLAGAFPEGFEARVTRDVGLLRSETCVGRATLPEPFTNDGPRMLIVDKPDAQAVAVSMGFPLDIERDDPDFPAIALAASWLGQHRQFVGRLMQAIRGQRGLNYGDYAYAEHFTQEGWSRFGLTNDARRQQYFSIWLRPLRPDAAHFAIRLAVRELRRFATEGLTQEQLDHIRTFSDRYLALDQQTASRRLGFAIDDAFYGVDTPHIERMRAAWAALTVEELNAAIRRHITPERLSIAVVSSEGDDLAQRIASEVASPVTYRTTVPESVTEEDREIVGYRLGIPRDRIRVVPVTSMFAE